MKTIVTHSGSMHPDDIVAVAILKILFPESDVVRTRDETVISAADFAVDVGAVYDPVTNRFDHHQVGGAGVRDNGIPYSACGLVWKHYGMQLCSHEVELYEEIENKIILPTDAADNSVRIYSSSLRIPVFDLSMIVKTMRPTWKEIKADPTVIDKAFTELVEYTIKLISRIIQKHRDVKLCEPDILDVYNSAEDKRYLVCEFPVSKHSFWTMKSRIPEVRFCIAQAEEDSWYVIAQKDSHGGFLALPPVEWRGKRGEELECVSGVIGACFCHSVGFYMDAISREAAIEMVQRSLV